MSLLSLPRRVEAVVFDMDGLLVDSERVFRDSMFAVSRAQGRELPLEVFLAMVGSPREASVRVATRHFGPAFDVEAWFEAVSAHAHAQMDADIVLKDGVVELLDTLEEMGLPRAVATSSSHSSVTRQLGSLEHRFQAVVAHGDYALGKPHPDPFLTAARRLGVAPGDCLALEDSHNGVRAAHAAGMMTIMVPDLLTATDEMRSLCVAIAETLHEVRDLLLAQHRA
jgi:HAD superfamily hydrolase (TIGR01509 family)